MQHPTLKDTGRCMSLLLLTQRLSLRPVNIMLRNCIRMTRTKWLDIQLTATPSNITTALYKLECLPKQLVLIHIHTLYLPHRHKCMLPPSIRRTPYRLFSTVPTRQTPLTISPLQCPRQRPYVFSIPSRALLKFSRSRPLGLPHLHLRSMV